MSIINRSINSHRLIRWPIVVLVMILPGAFSLVIYLLDEWLDERQSARKQIR